MKKFGLLFLSGIIAIGSSIATPLASAASPVVSVNVNVNAPDLGHLFLDDAGIRAQMALTPGQWANYQRIRDKHYKKWAKQAHKAEKAREKARKAYLKELKRYLNASQYQMFYAWSVGPGIGYHSAPRPGSLGKPVAGPKPILMTHDNRPGNPAIGHGKPHKFDKRPGNLTKPSKPGKPNKHDKHDKHDKRDKHDKHDKHGKHRH